MGKPVIFTNHAKTALLERDIVAAWAEHVVRQPQWTERDPFDPAATRYFGTVAERGGRYLRVAAVETPEHYRIVSVFLDRRARPK